MFYTLFILYHSIIPGDFQVSLPLYGAPELNENSFSSGHSSTRVKRSIYEIVQLEKALNLSGIPGQGYFVQLNIGTPSQEMNVLIDTGSSNFAVACKNHPFITSYFNETESSSLQILGKKVDVPYVQGSWNGTLVSDMVSLPQSNISIRSDLACIYNSDHFFINGSQWQGILGLAYRAISKPDSSVVPLFDTLVSSGHLRDVFSIQLCRSLVVSHAKSINHGRITFGGIEEKDFTGPVYKAAIHTERFYQIVVTNLTVDNTSLLSFFNCTELNKYKSIIDTGTTNIRLPTEVYKKVEELIVDYVRRKMREMGETESKIDQWLLFITNEHRMYSTCWSKTHLSLFYALFPELSFQIATDENTVFSVKLTPVQYLRPQYHYELRDKNKTCFRFAIDPSPSGLVLGAVFSESTYYLIFNRTEKSIGMAKSTCFNRLHEDVELLSGPFEWSKGSAYSCAYVSSAKSDETWVIVSYVIGGVSGVILLPLFIYLIFLEVKRYRQR